MPIVKKPLKRQLFFYYITAITELISSAKFSQAQIWWKGLHLEQDRRGPCLYGADICVRMKGLEYVKLSSSGRRMGVWGDV